MEPFGSRNEIKNRTRPKIRKFCQSLWIFSPHVNLFIDCYWAVLCIRGRRLTLCVCFFRLERFMLQLSLSESLQLEELLSSFSFLFSPLESNGSYSFDSYLSKVKGKSSFYLTFLSQCIYTRGVDRAGDKTLFLIAHESLLFITVFFSQEPKDGGVVIPSIHDHWVYLVNKFPGAVNEWLLSLTLLLSRHCPNAINVCLSFQEKAPPFFVMILTYVNPSVRCWWFFFTCLIDWREFRTVQIPASFEPSKPLNRLMKSPRVDNNNDFQCIFTQGILDIVVAWLEV